MNAPLKPESPRPGFLHHAAEFGVNVYRSLFRYGRVPRDPEGQSYAVFNNLFLHIHPVKVSRHSLRFTYTFGLGVIATILFLVLTFTGVWLMFYYFPSEHEAYDRMLDLRSSVDFGFVLRNVHKWSAELMVFIVILHMARVFFTGAYKPPREFNWVIGIVLLLLTLGLSFTGYLLPWDQLAFWAITVGTSIAGYAPVIGPPMRNFLLGGDVVGQEALVRFYVLHVVILPGLLSIFLAIHFWRIRKDGGLSHPSENDVPASGGGQ
jgi:quinol-cytochrome oxidoreductase complex cytochrome b subunit